MATLQNLIEGGTHGATVTGSSTAAGGTELTIAGAGGLATWDKSHHAVGDQSIRCAPNATTTALRQLVLPDATSPTSGAMSCLFMLGALPTTTGHTVAMVATASSPIMTATVLTDGSFRFMTGSTVLKTSTTKLAPWRWYRLEMAYKVGAAGASLLAGQVTPFGGAVIADSQFSSTATDISAKVCNGVQVGKVADGVTGDVWFDALRFDTGTTAFLGAWEPAVSTGVTATVSQVAINSGTGTASGTRSGDSVAITASDLSGALGDSDTATTAQLSQAGSFDLQLGNLRTTGGDLTVMLGIVSGGGTVQPLVDGVLVGSAKPVAATVTFTHAELGSPALGKLVTARVVPA